MCGFGYVLRSGAVLVLWVGLESLAMGGARVWWVALESVGGALCLGGLDTVFTGPFDPYGLPALGFC